jgi:hypothetical protein
MSDLLFDTPWWLPTILAGLGIYLFWSGNRRQESKVRNGGVILLAAAVVVLTLSFFVDTPKETAVNRTRTLIHSVEARDWTTLRNTMDPSVTLGVLGAMEMYGNRNQIAQGAQDAVERYGIKNVHVLSTTAERSEQLITVTTTVMSEQDYTSGYPITTSWKLQFQRSGKDWPLVRIDCIAIGKMTGEQAASHFPRPR